MTRAVSPLLLPLLCALALAGCSKAPSPQNDLDALDRELTDTNASSPAHDPVLTASLADQIMVDPGLTQQSNADAVRPPPRPDPGTTPPVNIATIPDRVDARTLIHAPSPSADCPECRAADGALTLGALAGRQSTPRTADCASGITYSAGWANRLPVDLPLYPDARVIEAAGAARPGCALRVVNFVSAAPPGKVVDWYYTRASKAGYSAGHKLDGEQHVVAGRRGDDAYIVYVSPRPSGGTDIDLVVNAGR